MQRNKNFELLAPGGDMESVLAAIAAGADAVYCGLARFNARNRATNISLDELKTLLPLAHAAGTKIFLTLNIMFLESEMRSLITLVNQIVQTDVDALIVQDLGFAYLLHRYFPFMECHASTQLNTHNQGQLLALSKLGMHRVNLARELSTKEIQPLSAKAKALGMAVEIFVHGSYCVSFSGLCYTSSAKNGASGNRGRCSQPCRDTFEPTAQGVTHPLNMKDNTAYQDLDLIAQTGAYSLKIEGRIKGAHYVYQTVKTWREQLDAFAQKGQVATDLVPLYEVFNRDFSAGYLENHIDQSMFIDNPRDNTADFLVKNKGLSLEAAKRQAYANKTQIIQRLKQDIKRLSVLKVDPSAPVKHKFVTINKVSHRGVCADLKTDKPCGVILIDNFALLSAVTGVKKLLAMRPQVDNLATQLDWTHPDIFYAMPAHFKGITSELVAQFHAFQQGVGAKLGLDLVPYFPAVLMGDDYIQAGEFLRQAQVTKIVSNNLGLGVWAHEQGIAWVAGPELNVANSYTLQCLQEIFGASGAFISDELNRVQILKIGAPKHFSLYYNLYHPISLMTSRQCFFLQSTGCHEHKRKVTTACLASCEKFAHLHNTNGETYVIHKAKGMYNQLVSDKMCLNEQILLDLPQFFSHGMLDLTSMGVSLKETTHSQYIKGL